MVSPEFDRQGLPPRLDVRPDDARQGLGLVLTSRAEVTLAPASDAPILQHGTPGVPPKADLRGWIGCAEEPDHRRRVLVGGRARPQTLVVPRTPAGDRTIVQHRTSDVLTDVHDNSMTSRRH